MRKALVPILCALIGAPAAAQAVPAPSLGGGEAPAMARLAGRLIAEYRDADRDAYLDNLFRLQLVAGRPDDAGNTLAELRALREREGHAQAAATARAFEIYAQASRRQASGGEPFDTAYRGAFQHALQALDDRMAARVQRALPDPQTSLFREEAKVLKPGGELSVAEALKLVRDYESDVEAATAGPLTAALAAEDNGRRYTVQADIPVRTPDGATVCALVVRPAKGPARLPALLNFTIYNNPEVNLRLARRSAANGYVGVGGLTRGKGCSPDKPTEFEHDGADADALIAWIAKQPWSDGRVGMWGGSYTGFTQWAAAKRLPKALKALMPQAVGAPGLDTPMDGGVFQNFIYPHPFYTTNNKTLDDATYGDAKRWAKLNRDWYVSGRAYRDLDKIDGTANPIFDRWLRHPTYDAYWQAMIPYGPEFARINIPVLSTAGYYYGGPGAAVYYFTEHQKHAPRAEDYLLIGPWDHLQAQNGLIDYRGQETKTSFGLAIDPVAILDLGELRYQWFDYVLKGGPKPAILKDRVNYEVVGDNRWGHAPSIAAMSNDKLTFRLSGRRDGDGFALSAPGEPVAGPVTLKVNLADRSDVDRTAPGGGIVDTAIDTWNSLKFISAPFAAPVEIGGLFAGRLDLVVNKKDFDFNIGLYELTAKGDYVLLSTYLARASQVGDLTRRRLLTPGKPTRLPFTSVRLASRRIATGSRLVVILGAVKEPDIQINYGTGKDVSAETIADAGPPLTITWADTSYLTLPIRR